MDALAGAALGAAAAAAGGFVTAPLTNGRLRVAGRPALTAGVIVVVGVFGALFYGVLGALAGFFASFLVGEGWLLVAIGAALPGCVLVAFWASCWHSRAASGS